MQQPLFLSFLVSCCRYLLQPKLGLVQIDRSRQGGRHFFKRSRSLNAHGVAQPARSQGQIHAQKEDNQGSQNVRENINAEELSK